MILLRIYQKKPFSSHRQLRWLYSSSAPPSPASLSGGGIQSNLSLMGPRSHACISRCTSSSSINSSDLKFPQNMRWCSFSTQALANHPVGGTVDVPLAQTGEGIAECELLKWFVREGDQVEEFQPLCEVQSDKATIEITSRYRGNVCQILHDPGDIVKVGETLLKMAVEETLTPAQTTETFKTAEELDFSKGGSDEQDSAPMETKTGGVLSTPVIRNLAKKFGIDISNIHGTGKDGRVLREDVLNAANKRTLESDLASSVSEEQSQGEELNSEVSGDNSLEYEDKTIQLRGFHRAMVKSMTLAAKVPHFHYVEEMVCDALVELKASFQNENSDPNVKFTFLPLLIKSLSMALRKYPMVNSCFNEGLYEVTTKGSHNVGIAMATPNGLVVPNIKNVQSLSILEDKIGKEVKNKQVLDIRFGPPAT